MMEEKTIQKKPSIHLFTFRQICSDGGTDFLKEKLGNSVLFSLGQTPDLDGHQVISQQLHLCPLLQLHQREASSQILHSISIFLFHFFLYSSSGILHLTPDAWQRSEEDNTINRTHNTRIRSTFDTRFISSTYWAGLTIQQRNWEVNLDIWPPIIQLPK